MQPLTRGIIDYIQKHRRIDVLFLLYEHGDEDGAIKWKEAKEFLPNISDGTYRDACRQLVRLGLAEAIAIDPLKYRYKLNEKGCVVASLIKEKLMDLDFLVQKMFTDIKESKTLN